MNKLPFENFPFLETERLILRKVDNVKDIADFFLLRSNASVMRYIPRPLAANEQDVIDLVNQGNEQYERGEMMNMAIALKDTNQFIGSVGFYRINWDAHRTEIGYILNPSYSGKGYVHEACTELVRFAFEEVGFHSLEAVIHPYNTASIKVVEKLGFVKEAHFKENEWFNGEFTDTFVYSLLNPNE